MTWKLTVMVSAETGELEMPDGRVVPYCLYGPEHGPPVVMHEGTPGSRLYSPKGVELTERAGVRVLTFNRPGYDGSSRRPGRTIADVVTDVATLADAQGWTRFAVVGRSGGGPHALACAALLPERVTRCAAVVSPAPFDAAGLDWFADMSPGNVAEFTLAQQGEAAYRPLLERIGADAFAAVKRGDPPITTEYELSEADLAQQRARLAEHDPSRIERTRSVWLDSIDGWMDDTIAMARPWGFDPGQTTVPVGVWYGPDDVLVPPPHAEWLLAHIPGAERHVLRGGHLLSDDSILEQFAWATAGDRRRDPPA